MSPAWTKKKTQKAKENEEAAAVKVTETVAVQKLRCGSGRPKKV